MSRALVIGGTGFLGIHIVDALLAAGASVRVTTRASSNTLLLRRRPVERVAASLDEPESLERALDGMDSVYFVAGHYPRYSLDRRGSCELASRQTENFVSAARSLGVRRVVAVSTLALLDEPSTKAPARAENLLTEEPTDSVYRAVKFVIDRTLVRAAEDGLPLVSLYPAGCLGPWDAHLGSTGFVAGLLTGRVPWYCDGLVNLIDVRDFASAAARALHGAVGSRYLMSTQLTSARTLFGLVVDRYGGKMPSDLLSLDEARRRAFEDEEAAAPSRSRVPLPRELVDILGAGQLVDTGPAERELGLVGRPLLETLDDTVEWLARIGVTALSAPRSKAKGMVT